MNYQKMFFPIGGGNELEERLHGAFLITKKLGIKLEIFKATLKPEADLFENYAIPKELINELDEIVKSRYEDENEDFIKLIKKISTEHDIELSLDTKKNNSPVSLKMKEGLRSELIEQESKFCDLVIAAAPPSGVTTATFETAVLQSGKPVLVFPRVMEKFSYDSIIIGWNNSPEASRAVSTSIDFLKKAQKVHIISSTEYTDDLEKLENLIDYLSYHDINATYEIVKTTRIPGQALLNCALDGNYDLIIAGAYGHKGLKELMFGGATRYLLENSTVPVFLSH